VAVVGLLTLEIRIEHSRSLKDRLRRRYSVSVAELEHQTTRKDSVVGVSTVASNQAQVELVLRAMENSAANRIGDHLVGSSWEIL